MGSQKGSHKMERFGPAAKVVLQAGALLAAASQLPPLSLAVIGVAALCGLGMLLYGRWKLQGQEQQHRELME
jgi:hypothetical protein